MKRGTQFAVMAVMAAGIATMDASAQSASSSNPFSRLFGGGKEQPVTNDKGEIIGPPVKLDFVIVDGDEKLEKPIRSASLIGGALAEDRVTGQDILAAARGDYARILGVMFDQGYFSAIIDITLDGVEAAEIAPLDAPDYIGEVVVTVDPGPRFAFGRADLAPLAPGMQVLRAYRVGEPAGTGTIKKATSQAISDWRDASHAKAAVADQEIIADHEVARLESRVDLDPGPLVTFGPLHTTGNERLSTRRLLKIAGHPEGETFTPEKLEDMRKRLRRSGIFSAITLVEAETLNPDNSMDVGLTVVEQKLRRIGAAFEISNVDGAMLSAYWLHRNLLGGGERFRVDAQVGDVDTTTNGDGLDYSFGVRIERPATLNPDTTGYFRVRLDEENEPEYYLKSAEVGLGFAYIRNERLTADIELQYAADRIRYGDDEFDYQVIALPGSVIWDRRDDIKNAREGFWLSGGATPFLGFQDTGSGLQMTVEGRVYHSVMTDDRLTFAGRARLGTVFGPDILDVPPTYLFFSGGGGSVRGQPYESLGFDIPLEGSTDEAFVGGQSILTLNFEARYRIGEKLGAVAFFDAGQIWDDSAWQGARKWHAGTGVGVRYDTRVGPLRFDVATPIHGNDNDSKVQLYLGLGQAF
ncbi:MAG: autotransporter assembly complex protein TamA [Paracoccus sp. (in: a-proteobacteria)]